MGDYSPAHDKMKRLYEEKSRAEDSKKIGWNGVALIVIVLIVGVGIGLLA